jgi:NADH-quinone oxidoreductase subunit G
VRSVQARDTHRAAAAALASGERKAVWLGALALRSPVFADLRALAAGIAELTGASLGVLAEGGNAAGAYLAGAVPHREAGAKPLANPGLTAGRMLSEPQRALVLFGGVEPWVDALDSNEVLRTLTAAELIVAITPYASEQLKQIAHVLLPIGTFAETSGTFVNLEGTWQSFTGAARPFGEARPGWKVLRVLGTELSVPGFGYQSSEEVREELRRLCGEHSAAYRGSHRVAPSDEPASSVDVPMYRIDAIVRRAASLQRTAEGRAAPVTY